MEGGDHTRTSGLLGPFWVFFFQQGTLLSGLWGHLHRPVGGFNTENHQKPPCIYSSSGGSRAALWSLFGPRAAFRFGLSQRGRWREGSRGGKKVHSHFTLYRILWALLSPGDCDCLFEMCESSSHPSAANNSAGKCWVFFSFHLLSKQEMTDSCRSATESASLGP